VRAVGTAPRHMFEVAPRVIFFFFFFWQTGAKAYVSRLTFYPELDIQESQAHASFTIRFLTAGCWIHTCGGAQVCSLPPRRSQC
jgi:hypothetical protein